MVSGSNCSDKKVNSGEAFYLNKLVPGFIFDLKEGLILEFNTLFRELFNTYGKIKLAKGVHLMNLMGADGYLRLIEILDLDGTVASKSVTLSNGNENSTLVFLIRAIPGTGCAEGYCSDKSLSYSVQILEERLAKRNEQLCRTNKKLQASLAEKDVMLKEIHHRVKNNLQIIHSILNLQSRYSNYPEILKILKEVQDRIKAMAFVHDCLCRSNDLTRVNMKVYINEIIMYLYQAYLSDDKDINIQTDIRQIELDLQRSITCGIIYNELISNSLKHAFTDSAGGWLKIAFEEQGEFYTISVCDDGRGIAGEVNTDTPGTFGLRLIKLLTEQLDGKISIESANGLNVKVIFPKICEEG